jgi:hypothetical protein
MARTTTATPAPAPRRKNGPVRSVTVKPEQLQEVDLSAPTLSLALPAHLAAALETAQLRQERPTRKAPPARVALTPAEAAALQCVGWQPPTVDANHTAKPQPRTRQNRCKGAAAYDAAAAVLNAGQSLKVSELAALWIASGGEAKPLNAIMQQVANRAGRVIQQNGATIAAV